MTKSNFKLSLFVLIIILFIFLVGTSLSESFTGDFYKKLSKSSPTPLISVNKTGSYCKDNTYCGSGLKCVNKKCVKIITPSSRNRPKETISSNGSVTRLFDSFCSPVVYNGNPLNKINFIIAFNGLTQEEINEKGYDLARAQFFRSEYKNRSSDLLFGFYGGNPNYYPAQKGMFELEPFSTYLNNFNVFYLTVPITGGISATTFADEHCKFRDRYSTGLDKAIYAQVKVLRKSETEGREWELEMAGLTWNHEYGHRFGLADEYYTTMAKNNLNEAEINNWNNRRLNCDYNKPLNTAGYVTGENYCTKWCDGVDTTNYQTYLRYRNLFDQCDSNLTTGVTEIEWLDFCMNELDYTKRLEENGRYQVNLQGTPSRRRIITNDLREACNLIYSANWINDAKKVEGIDEFCYYGSMHNIFDLNIGKNCMAGTGCYFGCGGFAREFYYPGEIVGGFGDAFRPNLLSMMGGGKFGDSSAGTWKQVGAAEGGVPSYGVYDTQIIENNIREKLAAIGA